MRFCLLATLAAGIFASVAPDDTFTCIVAPDARKFPHRDSGSIYIFMVTESINRITLPNRESISFAPEIRCGAKLDLLEWSKLSPEEFLDGALLMMGDSLRVAANRLGDQEGPLDELIASFDGEGGEEIRREYCLSFHRSLQAIPQSVWDAIPRPRLRK